MSFRCRQKLIIKSSHAICENEESFNKNGELVKGYVAQNKELPDPAMFDLKNLIDAGVDLEEVNSKVMRSRSVNADTVIRKYIKKDNETKTNEVNDEN